jgi:THO complex subunit 1
VATQISDLSFRRHILVQALIIMEFLLSLSSKAKEKLASVQPHNKAVTYMDQVLNEEDVRLSSASFPPECGLTNRIRQNGQVK